MNIMSAALIAAIIKRREGGIFEEMPDEELDYECPRCGEPMSSEDPDGCPACGAFLPGDCDPKDFFVED